MARRAKISAAAAGMVVGAGFLAANAGAAVAARSATAQPTDTRIVVAGEDTYVSSLTTGDNYGDADKLVIGTAAGETKTSFVKFDVPALPTGAQVTDAVLRMKVDGPTAAARVTAYPVAGAWSEVSLTGATQPAVGATAAGTTNPTTSDTVLRIDVAGTVTRAGSYSFALSSASTTAMTRLRSSEYAGASDRPQLQITYSAAAAPTPTPSPPAGNCVTGDLLVPSCGVLWGAAAGGFTDAPRDTALKDWETETGRTSAIFHTYHRGDEKFPTTAEIAMTKDPAHPRVLLENWKVSYNSTWAKTAAGAQDARIDAWAAYVKANYGTEKFFLVLHHEPENDVNPTAGSGMTAKDYAAMYRHVILRLRADKVTNVVNVLAYMGNEKWMAQSWWKDLYPGDDVVDWVGLDSYVSVEKGYYHYGDFGSLLDRQPTGGGLGFYDWSVKNHPTKPIMVAEWGMYHRKAYPTSKAAAFATVVPQLVKHPGVKAIVYFDTAADGTGDRNIAVDSTPDSLTAFKAVAADPIFNVKIGG